MLRAQFEGALYFTSIYAACVVYSRARSIRRARTIRGNTICELFQEAATIDSMGCTRLWSELLLYVAVMKLTSVGSDGCWLCQQKSIAITWSSNHPIEEKTMVCTVYVYKYKHTPVHTSHHQYPKVEGKEET